MLYGRCIEFAADLHQQLVARFPVCFARPNFDQFVRIKTCFQFANYGRSHAFAPDSDYRAERVCPRSKSASLGRCENEQISLRDGL